MTDPSDAGTRKLPSWIWLVAGVLLAAALASATEWLLGTGMPTRVLATALMLLGVVIGCYASWRASRSEADTGWRAELVGIVAFASVLAPSHRSFSDLIGKASFLQSFVDLAWTAVAVAIALFITKRLQGVDKHEAAGTGSK